VSLSYNILQQNKNYIHSKVKVLSHAIDPLFTTK
jgi:hypothetical protein